MILVLVIANLCAVLALLLRRQTILWRLRAEIAPTVNIAGIAVCLILISPHMSDFWGSTLHDLTGIWNTEELVGHGAYLAGVTALSYNMLNRLRMRDRDGLPATPLAKQRFLTGRIVLPAYVVPPIHVGLFMKGATDRQIPDFIGAATSTPWLTAYVAFIGAETAWVMGNLIWALRILRNDPRLRRSANIYLFAARTNAACALSIFISSIYPRWPAWIGWSTMALSAAIYSVAASYSWWRRAKVLEHHPRKPVDA